MRRSPATVMLQYYCGGAAACGRASARAGCDGGGCEDSRVRADYTIWRVSSLLFCVLSGAHLRLRNRPGEAKNIKFA